MEGGDIPAKTGRKTPALSNGALESLCWGLFDKLCCMLAPICALIFSFCRSVGNPWPCYRGHLGPSGRKLQMEFESGFPGSPGPGAQKVQNRVEKESKSTIFQLYRLFFDSVLDFLGPRSGTARQPIFELHLQLSARRAQMTPVAGKSFRNRSGGVSWAVASCSDFSIAQ